MAADKVYEIVTDQIIKKLEEGTIPWKRPWKTSGINMWPRNGKSNRGYTGINVFLLSMQGYSDPRWLTFKAVGEMGGKVRKGESGTMIVYWNFVEKEVENEKTGKREIKNIPFLRYYRVFNVQQTEGLNIEPLVEMPEVEWNPVTEAEIIISGYQNGPRINYVLQDRAYYKPSDDVITMPVIGQFPDANEYYATLFHELGHSTGHESRLNRMEESAVFGDPVYSREELVAEFCSAFLCATAGIDNTIDNSSAYIKGWAAKLREEPRLLVTAASRGQKAADWIIGTGEGDSDPS